MGKKKLQLRTDRVGRKGEIQFRPKIIAGNNEITLTGERHQNRGDVKAMFESMIADIKSGNYEFTDFDNSQEARLARKEADAKKRIEEKAKARAKE